MAYKNLVLLGSSHIAKQSIDEINQAFLRFKPGVVAIELDRGRLQQLMGEKPGKVSYRAISKVGIKGFLFAIIGKYVSEKLGKAVGIEPGADMREAALLARDNNAELALIDQDIQITLQRFGKEITWKEKWRFFSDMAKMMIFRKREMRKWGLEDFDLRRVPENVVVAKMMRHMKKRFPSVHKTLIAERNEIMARNLVRLMKLNPDKIVLAVVGAGHKEGITDIIKKRYNLTDISDNKAVYGSYSYSFSY